MRNNVYSCEKRKDKECKPANDYEKGIYTDRGLDREKRYKPYNAKISNITIMVWNIHGLSDKLGECDVQKMVNEHDIVGILETKKGIDFKIDYPGYNCYPFARKNKHDNAKSYSGGFLIMVSKKLKGVKVIQQTSEYVVWINISFTNKGKAQMLNLGIIYVSPQYSTYKGESDFFDSLSNEIVGKMTHGPIALCGDFNARTSNTDPSEYKDNPLFSYLNNFPRKNRDTKTNAYGRKLLDFCLQHDICILNGRDLPCTAHYTGDFTCYNHNGSSTVDYLITESELIQYLHDFRLLDMNANSDHRPLSFCFKLSFPKHHKKTTLREKFVKYRWDPSRKYDFHKILDSAQNIDLYNDFVCSIADNTTSHDDVINNFYELIMSAIHPVFKKAYPPNPNGTFPCNKWFDEQCKTLKSDLNHAIRNQAPIREQNLIRSEYKRMVQAKKRKFQEKTSF